MQVPFFRLDVTDDMRSAADEVIASGWLTSGPKVQAFEAAFAQATGARHAVAVNSCTAALHLALEALGVGPGDRVLVPTMTFAATAEVVRYLGADPVLADVCPETALLTPEVVESALARDPDISVCMPVHFGGLPCDMQAIGDICRAHDVRIVDDAAHALPAADTGGPVGTLADATCFSFYANKTLTTGEGGMLVTDDDAIAARARVMRLHGMNRDAWGRFTVDTARWEYDLVAPGYKYNMPDIAAALGLSQLDRRHCDRDARGAIATAYDEALGDLPNLRRCGRRTAASVEHAWHLYWIVLEPDAPINRNACIDALQALGVSCSVHYKPLHRMTYWIEQLDCTPEQFPGAEAIWRGCFSLPIFPALTSSEQGHVIDSLHQVLQG
ncbi:MAG: DegT/DnrJ/EryC1/StrS family aminotransferase [Phycisphaerales bacterium]|nr:DegT/DnrJ/EryC1/StrS family aminotransferase [Phycisphaerales bacterium]